jgi:uncharacterized membrane protein YeaQ/YmgE (transglycosylase-associated protein family)
MNGVGMFWFLLIGITAGWLSGKIVKGSGFGLLGDLLVGIIGAVLGGVLFSLVGLGAYGLIGNLIMSTVGAIVLLLILKQIRRS